MTRSSLTEETPATPSWVDGRIAELLGPLGPDMAAARNAYADCLAGARGAVDTDAAHDRCRRALLQAAEGKAAGAAGFDLAKLDRALQALEAEISEAT